MDAPKRIWAWVYADPWGNELRWFEWVNHTPQKGDSEYILAAEHARIVAEKDARIADLSDVLNAIEMLTATGDGLSPEETIQIHILAAEGRFDDPHAWRADPAVIARLRAALKGDDNG